MSETLEPTAWSALLLGLFTLAAALGALRNPGAWTTMIEEIEKSPSLQLLAGFAEMIAGAILYLANPWIPADLLTCVMKAIGGFMMVEALAVSLRMIKDEGIETVWKRTHTIAESVRQGMKALGLVPKDSPLYRGHPHWPAWEKLTPEQRRAESRRMAVYAAMVENMDRQIGRVLAHLERQGELERTVVIFMSDNGADGNSVYDVARTREWIHKDMDNSIENTGRPGSFIEYGPGWAQVGMTPMQFRRARR